MAEAVTGKKLKYVEGLLGGQGVPEAAASAGVSERTGYRWLSEHAAVKAALASALDARLDALAARTMGWAEAGMAELHRLATAEGVADYVKVHAAGKLADYAWKLYELRSLSERVAALEAKVGVA